MTLVYHEMYRCLEVSRFDLFVEQEDIRRCAKDTWNESWRLNEIG